MPGERWLIVNADDLGLSAATNRGIFQAHEHGIVTSASLMVRREAAVEAVEQSRAYPRLGLGLHVDLGDWRFENGEWRQTREIVPNDDRAAVRTEILRQLEQFRELTGRKPTHIDSHHNVHRDKLVRRVFMNVARRRRLPLRNFNSEVRFCGQYYGEANGRAVPEWISSDNLRRIIRELSDGVTELACHPGLDLELDSDYREQRPQEVRALCDPEVRAELEREHVLLRSFAEIDSRAN
jgi:chitin disaccharide deacetylase